MEPGLLQRLQETIDLVLSLPFEVRLWEAQNTYYRMMRDVAGDVRERAERWRRRSAGMAGRICETGREVESESPGFNAAESDSPLLARYAWT